MYAIVLLVSLVALGHEILMVRVLLKCRMFLTQLHRQETLNSVGGWEVNVPDTSDSSYGTVTDEG